MSRARHRPGSARPSMIGLVIAAVAALVVVVVVWRGGSRPITAPRIADAVDLPAPEPLTEEERGGAPSGLDSQTMVRLESGAWIEVADPETGRLAQRYSAARVDPLPDQWVRMEQPRASFHTGGGRIVTLSGDSAVARVPRRALESGRIDGSVVVRIYRADADGRIRPDVDPPSVEILTDNADYDSTVGHLRCDGRVEVRTAALRFVGRGLTLLLESGGQRAEELVVDEALEPIRIDLLALRGERDQPEPAAPATAPSVAEQASPPVDAARPQEPAAAEPAPRGAVATPASPYRLTLHDDVLIRRFQDGAESTVTGDRLAMVFALDGDGPGRQVVGPVAPAPMRMPTDTSLASTLLTLPFGATELAHREPPTPEDRLEITYSGRLVMVQTIDPADQLLTDDDTMLEVIGAPVVIEDPAAALRGTCASLRYRTANGRLDLRGEPARGIAIDAPELALRGDHLWIVRASGAGRIEGPGRMILRQAPGAAAEPVGQRRGARAPLRSAHATTLGIVGDGHDLSPLAITLLASIAGSLGQGIAPPFADPPVIASPVTESPVAESPGHETLEILWSDGVDLTFDPGSDGEDGGRLREAKFRGDVRASGDDFSLRSEDLRVEFAGAGEPEQSISEIEATGGVAVDRLGAAGTMTCRTLVVSMESHEGRSIPSRMVATDDVVARDAEQTVWSDEVIITFRPKVDAPDASAVAQSNTASGQPEPASPTAPSPTETAPPEEDRLGGAEVETVRATGDVRVQMRDGAMIFADELDGDAIRRQIRLQGEDVLLLRDRVVADRMRSVRFDEVARTAHGDGPGRFRLLVAAPPPETPSTDPAARPRRPELGSAARELEATWTRAMAIDETTNDGAGSIELRGNVSAVAEPDALRRDTIQADTVVIEMRHRATEAEDPSAEGETPEALARTRDLARLIARTEADLQSRRWSEPGRTDEPKLFRVRGQHVEHDAVTGESLVVGNGNLLVHDSTPATEQEATGFGRRGTASFSWNQRMEMRLIVDQRYLITMEDGVEVLHAGLAPADELTLTTDRLEATVERGVAGADGQRRPDGLDAREDRSDDPLGLGGSSDLRRLRAVGRTFVATPEYRVDCHEFDYDTDTGIARLSARPGRVVRALVTRTASPIQAQSMVWDLRLGRLQITQGGGGALR